MAHRRGSASTAPTDAVEFIDVHKAFGRNTILNGLNLGMPDDQISMILGPVRHRQVGVHQAHGRPALPRRGRRARSRRVGAEHGRRRALRDAQEVRRPVPGRRAVRLDERVRQRRVPAPPAHRQGRGGDQRDRLARLGRWASPAPRDKMPNELSGGMRKRAGFARALVLEPDIVLFDEPDSGLDPVRTALLCELIKEIHKENGGAYVVITHDIMRRGAWPITSQSCGRAASSNRVRRPSSSTPQPVREPVPLGRGTGSTGHGVAALTALLS